MVVPQPEAMMEQGGRQSTGPVSQGEQTEPAGWPMGAGGGVGKE